MVEEEELHRRRLGYGDGPMDESTGDLLTSSSRRACPQKSDNC